MQRRGFHLFIRFPYQGERETAKNSARFYSDYTDAVVSEICWRAHEPHWLGRPLTRVTVGGSSSWLLHGKCVNRLLAGIRGAFTWRENTFCVFRADPQHCYPHTSNWLAGEGVDALLLRSHSLHTPTLSRLKFPYRATRIEHVVESAAKSSLQYLGLEHWLGVPGQSQAEQRHELAQLLVLEPRHILLRPFRTLASVPRAVRLIARAARKQERKVEREKLLRVYNGALSCAGYLPVAEDEFALCSFETLGVPRGFEDTLGVGLAAESRLRTESGGNLRVLNARGCSSYFRRIFASGTAIARSQQLAPADLYHEYLLETLGRGLPLHLGKIRHLFDLDINQVHPGLITVLEDTGYVSAQGEQIALTDRGMSVAENVARNFFVKENEIDSPEFFKPQSNEWPALL